MISDTVKAGHRAGTKRGTLRSIHLYFDVATLMLAAITWFLFTQVDAWRDIGAELLANPSFDTGLAGWHASREVKRGQIGAIDLSGFNQSESHDINQVVNRPANGYIRITSKVRMQRVRRGPLGWQSARVGIGGIDAAGKPHWNFPHKLLAETGTHASAVFSRVFYVPPRFHRVMVEAELTGGTGRFIVSRLSARSVEPKPLVLTLKRILLGGWVVFIAIVLAALVRCRAWQLFVALVPGGAFFLFIPHDLLLLTEALTTFKGFHLKLDHLALLTLMTCVALWGNRTRRLVPILHLAVLGVAVEAVQFFLPGRTSGLVDILSDLLGIALGVMVVEIGSRLNRSHHVLERLHL